MSSVETVVAASVGCYINSKLCGRVGSFVFTINDPKKAIEGIDIPFVLEWAPTRTSVSGTLGLWRTAGDGGVEGLGMAAVGANIIRERYFTLQLITRKSEITIFQCDNCVIQSQTWNIQEKTRMTGMVSFSGILSSNEVT